MHAASLGLPYVNTTTYTFVHACCNAQNFRGLKISDKESYRLHYEILPMTEECHQYFNNCNWILEN